MTPVPRFTALRGQRVRVLERLRIHCESMRVLLSAYKTCQTSCNNNNNNNNNDNNNNSLSDNVNKARLLAVTAPHSGDWLHALPLSNCGLRLESMTVPYTSRSGFDWAPTSVSRISVHVEHRSMPEVYTVSRVKGAPADQLDITG